MHLTNERIIDVAAGNKHSLFVSGMHRVYACGESKSGQLGIGQGTI